MQPNGGNRWVSLTQAVQKVHGTMIHDSGLLAINGQPYYSSFNLDLKTRTINLPSLGRALSVLRGRRQGTTRSGGRDAASQRRPARRFRRGRFRRRICSRRPGRRLRGQVDPKELQRIIEQLKRIEAQPPMQVLTEIEVPIELERLIRRPLTK